MDEKSSSDLPSRFTPRKVVDSDDLSDIKLSPDASQVLYHVKPLYRSTEHATCAIWLADVSSAGSARQFTSGLFNDSAARFHPDGQRLVFLSDRHKAGGPLQLYSINLSGGESSLLFGRENKKGVTAFEISPDGRYVAFRSADEPTPEDQSREKEKDDAKVFGDRRAFDRLRLFSFATGDIRTLDISKDRHVASHTWTTDSKELLFTTWSQPELEFVVEETALERISIAAGAGRSQIIGMYSQTPSDMLICSNGEVVDIQRFTPARLCDSKSVFVHAAEDFSRTTRLYGEVDDAVRTVDLKGDGLVAVEIASGVHTRIDVLDLSSAKRDILFTLYETDNDAIETWDGRRLSDGTCIFVAVKSSVVMQDPPDVWAGTIPHGQPKRGKLKTKLSSHLQWMKEVSKMHTEVLKWVAEDGTELEGIVTFPPGINESGPAEPLPTIMIIHGGPYWRDTLNYVPHFALWQFLLASHGYMVIRPNYRGSQGRGSTFARTAEGGIGKLDWADCESMLDDVVKRGFADSQRLGIGGWSQGGTMTAWGITATKNRFKAGVMGAGISDWGQLAAESDLPDTIANLGGYAPWDTHILSKRVDLNGSAVGHVVDVETPVLILHGEEDQRVPVTQGIAFFRGLRRRSKYPERAQLVIYPREPHVFMEKKHAEDAMKRVIEHFDAWL